MAFGLSGGVSMKLSFLVQNHFGSDFELSILISSLALCFIGFDSVAVILGAMAQIHVMPVLHFAPRLSHLTLNFTAADPS